MKLRRLLALLALSSAAASACSSGSSTTAACCDIGTSTPGVPSCICGSQTNDAGSCKVVSTIGQTCTISCNGQTAGGQTAMSCTDQ